MKKIMILTLAISLLPGLALAQGNSDLMRAELEQARQEKDEAMDLISLEANLMRSAMRSSGPARLSANQRPVVKPLLHPAFLSLPGRVVMTVLAPAPTLRSPSGLPLIVQKPAVTIELTMDREAPSKIDRGSGS